MWRVRTFYGISPRLREGLLPSNAATVAHNVDLTHGTLRSFLEPRRVAPADEGAVFLHAWGCELLTWEKCVSVAEWLPDCPRLFVTGNAEYPQVLTLSNGVKTYRRLGVPAPPSAPTISASDVQNNKSRNVAYITTFVNSFGEEGGASMPSAEAVIEDGQAVDIYFRYNTPAEYDIKSVRIYRRESGFHTGLEQETTMSTGWFFIAEVPVAQRLYTDTTKIMDVGWGFDGIDTREPPAELQHITSINNSAALVGAVKNKLVFSKNLQPHNWLLSQEITLDDHVLAMGSVGNRLFIATDGHPYIVEADADCDKTACRSVLKYEQSFPMINCHHGHSSVITPFGLIYASTDGLVLLSDGGTPRVITSEVLSQDDWRKLEPHTTRLAYNKGALFVVTSKISFILWLDQTTYTSAENKKMTTISDQPLDMVVTRQDELLFLTDDGVFQWNAGDKKRPYRWVSSTIDFGFFFDLTRVHANVLQGNAKISTMSHRAVISRNFPTGERSIPYNRHGRVKKMYIEVEGCGELTELSAGVCDIDLGAITQ